jgi:hypothetical protein
MVRRAKMLRHEISPRGKPNLDALNAFTVGSISGVVLKEHSQIVQFHSEKKFDDLAETRILVRPVSG